MKEQILISHIFLYIFLLLLKYINKIKGAGFESFISSILKGNCQNFCER